MSYSTDDDIITRLSEQRVQQMTDDDKVGAIDTGILAEVRGDVTRKIDLKLRGRYDVPVTDPDAVKVLKSLEVDLLAERLYMRRPNREVPDSVRQAAKDARTVLDAIRDGKDSLGIDSDADGQDDRTVSLKVKRDLQGRDTLKDQMTNY